MQDWTRRLIGLRVRLIRRSKKKRADWRAQTTTPRSQHHDIDRAISTPISAPAVATQPTRARTSAWAHDRRAIHLIIAQSSAGRRVGPGLLAGRRAGLAGRTATTDHIVRNGAIHRYLILGTHDVAIAEND